MKIIGICGSSGSGKSTVCSILSALGAAVLNCDEIYHDLVSKKTPCLDEIAKEFGEDLIVNDQLDRAKLAKIVFSDQEKLALLNRISHHHVSNEIKRRLSILEKESCKVSVIDAPLLFEAGLDLWCDLVCAVIASENLQVSRLCKRDKISAYDAKLRLQHQKSSQELQEKADFIIENNGQIDSLKEKCYELMETVLKQKG